MHLKRALDINELLFSISYFYTLLLGASIYYSVFLTPKSNSVNNAIKFSVNTIKISKHYSCEKEIQN